MGCSYRGWSIKNGKNKDSSRLDIFIHLRKLKMSTSKADSPKTLEKSNNYQIAIMGNISNYYYSLLLIVGVLKI